MGTKAYEHRQIASAQSDVLVIKVIVLAVVAMLVAVAVSVHFALKQRERNATAQAAYKTAVSKAPVEIEHAFKQWSTTTVDSGTALKWSGLDSDILYIQHIPELVGSGGSDSPEFWKVWARSKNGRIFVVTVWLNDKFQFEPSVNVKQVRQDELLEVLIQNKQEDLARKLNLPVKPA